MYAKVKVPEDENNSQGKRGGFMIHSNDDVPYHERKIKRPALKRTDL